MVTSSRMRFLRISLAGSLLAIVIAAIASPPDPFTLVLYVVPLWLVALILSYGLVYCS